MASKVLAVRVGVTPSMVSRWERQGVVPSAPTIRKIAEVLEVDLNDLVSPGTSDVEDLGRDITRGYKKNDIPVISDAEASSDGFIIWDDEGVVKGHVERRVSRAFSDGDPRAIGFRVRGDSMTPRYRQGEVVIVQPRLPARDGDDVIVVLTTGERLIKRAFRRDRGWILHSENHLYPDRLATDEDVVAIYPIRHHVNVTGR